MHEHELTGRQQRERNYYDKEAQVSGLPAVSFEAVESVKRRPWNSYWFVYDRVIDLFRDQETKLLDYGCGNGVTTMRFTRIGFRTSAFDISPNRITIAGELADKYNLTHRIDFSVQTAEKVNYDDNRFDVIVGIDILHHVDIDSAVREIYRILKPGGTAVFREMIQVPIFDHIRNWRAVRYFFPNAESLEKHITADEHKLNKVEVNTIISTFSDCEVHRFVLFSRVGIFLKWIPFLSLGALERLDYYLFKSFPFLRRFGGAVVFCLRK